MTGLSEGRRSRSGRLDSPQPTWRLLLHCRPPRRSRLVLRARADARPGQCQAFLKAVEVGPGDWTAHNQLGGFYFTAGRLDEAASSFERVLTLAPDNVRAYNNLGLSLIHISEPTRLLSIS